RSHRATNPNGDHPDPRTQLINRERCIARDLALRQGAMTKNILRGSLPDEQRRRSGKDRQRFGLSSDGRLPTLLLSHRTLRLCSFVAPCQPPRQSLGPPISYL